MIHNASAKTILILAANPQNTTRLRLEEEIREIDEGLRRANQRHQYKLEQKLAVRSRDFYRAILDYKPSIVHFCGHGVGQEGIVLQDETGKSAIVPTDALASMFKLFAKKGVECVVLNACYSEVQAEAISQYVNYVVGMNRAVGDQAAVTFAVAFYDTIAAGGEVEEAYELGCSQMISFLEHETPVFKKRKPSDADDEVSINFEDIIPPNPYQGLAAFGEEDADFFFGQEKFVNHVVEVTQKQPLVAVVGPSGSGKSSVVFAGLIPKIRKDKNWLIESFRPGKEPFLSLASALVRQLEPEAGATQQLRETVGLSGDLKQGRVTMQQVVSRILDRNVGKKLLLVADQFEEFYTLCQNKEEQELFSEGLLTAISQENITLVFTLRADFIGYVLSYRPFRDALQDYTPQFLSSMKREELQHAIELPAQKLDVELETQLTQRILDDVGEEPGNLPLLEFALTRLWEKQINRELTHQAYEEIGGVKKAIANHAEQVYQKFSESQKKKAQQIFVQLIRPGEGTEDTRRVATREEVGEDNWNLVSYLAGYQARLVVTGRDEKTGLDTVEVVHEALIREWGTFREWINASRDFRTWQEQLKVALRQWKKNNHDVGGLLRGVPLSVAEDWLQQRRDEMTLEERDFIQVSAQERDREKQETERKRRLTIIGLSGFSAITLSLATIAGVSWREARISQINALAQYSDGLLGSDGSKAVKTSLKALLAMQKTPWVDADTHTQVELALLNTVSNVAAPNTLGGHANCIYAVGFSPDGKLLASGSNDKTVRLWDVSTGKEINVLGHTNGVWGVSFSPNSKLLASGSDDKTVRLWDIATSQQINTLIGHINELNTVSFSPDSKLLASGSSDKTVRLWDVATGKEINTLTGHTNIVTSVSFSSDSKLLASSSFDNTVKLWDVATGKEIKTLTGHTNEIWGVSFSPDSKVLASASNDNTVKLWDVATGKEINTLTGHTNIVTSVSFSPDSKLLASSSNDNTVKLWDVATGKQIKTLAGHTSSVRSINFSPDNKVIASGSCDNTVKMWDVATGKPINTLTGHTSSVKSISFSPDGKRFASGSNDNTVKLWDVATGKEIKTLTGHTSSVRSISFSPDGKVMASGSNDNTVKLWDVTTGKEINTLTGHTNEIWGVSFSPDGKMLASSSADNTVKLWDVATGQQINTLTGHTERVNDVSFSPDGKMLASSSADNTVKLWDVATGKPINTLTEPSTVNGISFSPDGKVLASTNADNTVKLWEVATGQQINTLTGHTDWVSDVSFSTDNKILASAGGDSKVKLWDTATGKEIKTLTGHTRAVNSINFSPNDKLLATGGDDKTVKLWRWDLDYLVQEGCKYIENYLKPNPNDAEALKIDKELCSKIQ